MTTIFVCVNIDNTREYIFMYMYMYEQSKYCEFPLESRVFIRAIVRIPLWHFDQRMSLETEGFHSSSFLCSFFFFFLFLLSPTLVDLNIQSQRHTSHPSVSGIVCTDVCRVHVNSQRKNQPFPQTKQRKP